MVTGKAKSINTKIEDQMAPFQNAMRSMTEL